MAHRIRFALHEGSFENMLTGEVKADESFIGGKARNIHLDKKARRIPGTGTKDKVAVMGIYLTCLRKSLPAIAEVFS